MQAFRTLKLLEQHHEKLSQLLKFQTSHPVPPKSDGGVASIEAAPPAPLPNPAKGQDGTLYRPQSQSLPAAHRPQQDTSSSIAGTLASARGIPSSKQRRSGQPSSPAVAQQNAEGRIVTPPRRSKLGEAPGSTRHDETVSEKSATGGQSTRRDTTVPLSKETVPDSSPKPADDAFNRFYNTFESLFSKLSAPLAFAGLPLNPDADDNTAANDLVSPNKQPSSNALTPKSKKSSRNPSTSVAPSRRATAEPAYSQLFSPAALAAVREEPGNAALGAPGESFYVVPTTGGTMPYASILARHQQHSAGTHHHNRSLSRDSSALSEDIDEFVDARETPGLGGAGGDSPVMSRTTITNNSKKRGGGGGGPNQKNMEELQLENESLRSVLDEMSRRLWQFEMGAQMGSVALHQSIRASLNRGPCSSTDGGGGNKDRAATATTATSTAVADNGGSNNNTNSRLTHPEDDLKRQKREMERMGRENEKLKGVVGRYRERWEKLKEGARTRQKVPNTNANANTEAGGKGGGGGEEAMVEGEEI